jgi:hypothetical protein
MAVETQNSTQEYPATLQELVDDMQHPSGKYKNLQIILNRNDNRYLGLGQKYLVVSHEGFAVYRLLDIHYAKGIIRLDLENMSNGSISSTPLDVNNKHPELFLLAWEDIRQLVFENTIRRIIDDELLELEERVTTHEKNISSSGRKV